MNSLQQLPLIALVSSDSQLTPPEGENYVPGVCNIGKKEISKRRDAAFICLMLCLLFISAVEFAGLSKGFRLLLFFPAAALGITFQQWHLKFCVAFGLKGIFNFEEVGKTSSVEEKEYLRRDYLKAWKLILLGVAFGLIASMVFFFLP